MSCPACGVSPATLTCPAPIFTPQVVVLKPIVLASICIFAFVLTSPDAALPRVRRAPGSGHGMELHGWPARRHLGVTGPPGGMPAAAQRPRSGGGAWAARLTEGSRRPLSYLVEPPRALADRDAPFSCRLRPRSPRCRGVPVQNIDVSFDFNILASRAQKQLKAEFDAVSTEVSVASRTTAHTPHKPLLQPRSRPPTHLNHSHPPCHH